MKFASPSRQQLPATTRRSKAIKISLGGWWSFVICAGGAWWALNSEQESLIRVGSWLVAFAALGSIAGWAGAVGSILNDRGRIRAGAMILMGIPLVGIVFSWNILTDTTIDVADPWAASWLAVTCVMLVIASVLICVPAESASVRRRDM